MSGVFFGGGPETMCLMMSVHHCFFIFSNFIQDPATQQALWWLRALHVNAMNCYKLFHWRFKQSNSLISQLHQSVNFFNVLKSFNVLVFFFLPLFTELSSFHWGVSFQITRSYKFSPSTICYTVSEGNWHFMLRSWNFLIKVYISTI